MTPLRFGVCVRCSRSIPAHMSLCFDCIEQDMQPRVGTPSTPTVSVDPPLIGSDWISPEPAWASAEAVAQWAEEQHQQDLKVWEARVKSVRWQSFFLFLPCFGLFLAFRSWPFIVLVIAVNFLGWRRIRRAESLRPVKPQLN